MGKKCVVARPIHVSNSHTKFGWISSNGLGGDIVTEGQTEAIAISPLLFKKKKCMGILMKLVYVCVFVDCDCLIYCSIL